MCNSSYILQVNSLITGYDKKQVINGVTIEIEAGDIVALIGHNGAGKSTLLKAIFGLLPIWSGKISLGGKHYSSLNPSTLLKAGIVYVPQGNRVFTELTVYENLVISGTIHKKGPQLRDNIERAITLFPALKDRMRQQAGYLSGGEKQMLALANALVLSPRLLLLDEPSLGLGPSLVVDVFEKIKKLNENFGITAFIAEQRIREVLKISRRAYVFRSGLISFHGSSKSLEDELTLQGALF